MSEEPIISIDLPKNQKLVFYEHFLLCRDDRINYKEIQGISYLWTKVKTEVFVVFVFVPYNSKDKYLIKIKTAEKTYNINFSSTLFGFGDDDEKREKIFSQTVHAIEKIIKPILISNLLLEYRKTHKIKSESLTITSDGLYKERLLRDPEFLSWDQYYASFLIKGFLIIMKKDPVKEYKEFFRCSMSVINAVILPDILNFWDPSRSVALEAAFYSELHKARDEAWFKPTKKSSDTNDKRFCSSCGEPIGLNSRFCAHCGNKLK